MSATMNWFRKRQKLLLGIFGVALMVVFTVSLGSGTDPLLDMLSGNWTGSGNRGELVVKWDSGKLYEADMESLRMNRRVLIQYLGTLMQQAIKKGGEPRRFGIDTRYSDDALLENQMLLSEANRYGIAVSDDEILDFLGDITDDRLQQSDFSDTWKEVTSGRLSNKQLFELLRRELSGQRVATLIRIGGWPTSPIQSWELFNRLERRVSVEMMPLKVDQFVDEVGDPSEAELREFYEEHKEFYPFPDNPLPGFKQRERRAFQCVKFDFAEFLRSESKLISDAEVAEYYEKNKSEFPASTLPSSDLELPESTDKAETEPESTPSPLPQDEADPSDTPDTSDALDASETSDTSDSSVTSDESAPSDTSDVTEATDASEATDANDDAQSEESPYRPLKEVSQEIRDILAAPKARIRLETAMSRARQAITAAVQARMQNAKPSGSVGEIKLDLSEFSQDPVLTIETIPASDAVEIQKLEIGLGRSSDIEQREGGESWVPFLEVGYGPGITPGQVDVFPRNQFRFPKYLYWMTALEPDFVPSLDEIRETVELVWKRRKAFELAKDAAETEADKARGEPGKPLSTVSAAEGREFLGPLEVRWVTTGSVPSSNEVTPMLATIDGVDGTTDEMLRTIFRMNPGDIGVVTDQTQETVYVVRCIQDGPEPEVRRNVFLQEVLQRMSPDSQTVNFLRNAERQQQVGGWYQNLLESKGVEWLREPGFSG